MRYPLQNVSIAKNIFTHEYPIPLTLQANYIDEQCVEPYFEFRFNGSTESTFQLYYARTQKHCIFTMIIHKHFYHSHFYVSV
jgi:hypothetical protein